jgi:hypothetical protein
MIRSKWLFSITALLGMLTPAGSMVTERERTAGSRTAASEDDIATAALDYQFWGR